jgi:hypothetical protein
MEQTKKKRKRKRTSVVLVCVLAHRTICGQAQIAEEAGLQSDRTLSHHDHHTDELFEPFGVVLPIRVVSSLVHTLALQKGISGCRGSRNTWQQFSNLIFFASSGLIDEETNIVVSSVRAIRQK